MSKQTAALSATPHLLGTHGLWGDKKLKLPNYIENIAAALMKTHGESESIQMAIGICRRWASGQGKVSPEVRAAAAKAIAEFDKLRATHNKGRK